MLHLELLLVICVFYPLPVCLCAAQLKPGHLDVFVENV